jgi:hypothetical protein
VTTSPADRWPCMIKPPILASYPSPSAIISSRLVMVPMDSVLLGGVCPTCDIMR